MASSVVADSSAILAVIFGEKGAEFVIARLPGALVSAVNLAEVTTRALDLGMQLDDAIRQIERLPIHLVPYDVEQAHITASLRGATKALGLSLGDRACLALALHRNASVLTGDRDWRKLSVGVEIVLIR